MLIVLYAHAGRGKTVDAWAACAGQGVILGSKADVGPIRTVYGVDASGRTANVEDLGGLYRLIEKIPAKRPLVVDDLSRILVAERVSLESEFELQKDGEVVGVDRRMWNVLRRRFGLVMDQLRLREGLTIVTGRQLDRKPAVVDEKGRVKEAPKSEGIDLGWDRLIPQLAHEAHLVCRYEVGTEAWDGRAVCDPLDVGVHKDRLTVYESDRPANLGAIFRAAEVEGTPRWEGENAWIEKAIEAMAGDGDKDRKAKAKRLVEAGKPRGLIYLAVRTARHVAELRAAKDLLGAQL